MSSKVCTKCRQSEYDEDNRTTEVSSLGTISVTCD